MKQIFHPLKAGLAALALITLFPLVCTPAHAVTWKRLAEEPISASEAPLSKNQKKDQERIKLHKIALDKGNPTALLNESFFCFGIHSLSSVAGYKQDFNKGRRILGLASEKGSITAKITLALYKFVGGCRLKEDAEKLDLIKSLIYGVREDRRNKGAAAPAKWEPKDLSYWANYFCSNENPPQKRNIGLKLWSKLAKEGDGTAQRSVIVDYIKKIDLDHLLNETAEWSQEEQCLWGKAFYSGKELSEDGEHFPQGPDLGLGLLFQAAKKSNKDAQEFLIYVCYLGEKSAAEQLQLQNAIAGWSAEDLYARGCFFSSREDSKERDVGHLLLTQAGKKGDADAQNTLAGVYLSSELTQENFEEGFKWLEMAAAQGHPKALFNLATLHSDLHPFSSRLTESPAQKLEKTLAYLRQADGAGSRGAADALKLYVSWKVNDLLDPKTKLKMLQKTIQEADALRRAQRSGSAAQKK
jgi:TPR repeat protein